MPTVKSYDRNGSDYTVAKIGNCIFVEEKETSFAIAFTIGETPMRIIESGLGAFEYLKCGQAEQIFEIIRQYLYNR